MRQERNQATLGSILGNRGRVLYAIARGRDMTKLQIKNDTSLSMTTVLAAVDDLLKEKWITLEERKSPKGGKAHSSVNVHPDRCVYGISYKGGSLYGAAVNLRGEQIASVVSHAKRGPESAAAQVFEIVRKLTTTTSYPSAIALALNCEDLSGLVEKLGGEFGVPIRPTANTAAIGYRALWHGGGYPLSVIGVGARVKCYSFCDGACRAVAVGEIPSAPIFDEIGSYASLLAASRVEEILRSEEYERVEYREEGKVRKVKDSAGYSRVLAQGVASLVDLTDSFLQSTEIRLFGEYISEGFFRRVQDASMVREKLRRESADGPDFAYGTALCALTECVLNE